MTTVYEKSINLSQPERVAKERSQNIHRLARLAFNSERRAGRVEAHAAKLSEQEQAHTEAARVMTPLIDILAGNLAKRGESVDVIKASRATPDGRQISLAYDRAIGRGRKHAIDPNFDGWRMELDNSSGEPTASYYVRLNSPNSRELPEVRLIGKAGRQIPMDSLSLEDATAAYREVAANMSWLAAGLPDRSLSVETVAAAASAATSSHAARHQARVKPQLVGQST